MNVPTGSVTNRNLFNICKIIKFNLDVKALGNSGLVTKVQLLNFKTSFFYIDVSEKLPRYTDDYVHAVILFYL